MSLTILYTPEFKRDYKKLPLEVREALKTRGRLFQENPFHPLIKTHKLSGTLKELWSFSIDYRIRVIFEFKGNKEALLLRVGDHSIYRRR